MRFQMIAAAGVFALATALPGAAVAQPGQQQQQRGTYTALGTEPFWQLKIDARTMRFDRLGQRPVTITTPRVIHGFAGETYQTRRMNVNIVHRECSDGMSDRRYADTVTVRLDGRTYNGCGGDVVTQRPVPIDGNWMIEALNGRPVAQGTTPTVRFERGSISGNASCNNFRGTYELSRGRLTTGPLASTKKACFERTRNVQETTILDMLGERLTVSSNPAGKLVLSAADGRSMTLRPAR